MSIPNELPDRHIAQANMFLQSAIDIAKSKDEDIEPDEDTTLNIEELITAADASDIAQQIAYSGSELTGGNYKATMAITGTAAGLGVILTTTSGLLAYAIREDIAKKKARLQDLGQGVIPTIVTEERELRREIDELEHLKQTSDAAFAAAVIDNSAAISAFGIEASQASTTAAHTASSLLWSVSWVAGGGISLYLLVDSYEKNKQLLEGTEKTNALYAQLEEANKDTNQNTTVTETLEDLCLLRDQSVSNQWEKLRISYAQNGIILAASVLGVTVTILTLTHGVSPTVFQGINLGSMVGVGIGAGIGVSYYLYKSRHINLNRFKRLLAWATRDKQTYDKLLKEAHEISILEKFDATASLAKEQVNKAKAKWKELKAKKAEDANREEIEKLGKEIETLEDRVSMTAKERLDRLSNNLMKILKDPTKYDTDKISDAMVALGIDESEIDLREKTQTIRQIFKALVA